MALQTLKGIRIVGMTVCMPSTVVENADMPFEGMERMIKTTGIERRRVAPVGLTSSDLCVRASEDVLNGTNTDTEDIGLIVFVTQSPDYKAPSTAHIIQDRLGASHECLTFQINEGCSGYVHGLYLASVMLKGMPGKKALLLVGDTSSADCNIEDKSTRPLFGDAGTATLLENNKNAEAIHFYMGGDGSGYKDIIIPHGSGGRHKVTDKSFQVVEENGLKRRPVDLHLDGMNVFTFGITKVPKAVKYHWGELGIDAGSIDYAVFHQANMMMNEKIRKKLKLAPEQVPYSLKNYGNTSGASVPVTMVTQLKEALTSETKKYFLCGFGIGVSWANAYLTIPPLQYVNQTDYD